MTRCEVCCDAEATETIQDEYTPEGPVHMCGRCADDHEAARVEGNLAH